MYKPIFCLSQNIGQTAMIVSQLKEAGFSNNEVSVVFPDHLSTELPVDAKRDPTDQTSTVALNVGVDHG